MSVNIKKSKNIFEKKVEIYSFNFYVNLNKKYNYDTTKTTATTTMIKSTRIRKPEFAYHIEKRSLENQYFKV